jgi:prepilin-type N-terminal cleavage/methylation domain-containing protein
MLETLKSRLHGSPESGFTLIELIVASAMAVVITGAAVAMLVTALKDQPKVSGQADQVGEARVAVAHLTRELRQGVVGSVHESASPSSGKLTFETYVQTPCAGVTTTEPCKVTYECATVPALEAPANGRCTRVTSRGSVKSAPTTVVSGISNPTSVFRYLVARPNCPGAAETTTYVTVTLEFPDPAAGSGTTLQDGAGLRSCPA